MGLLELDRIHPDHTWVSRKVGNGQYELEAGVLQNMIIRRNILDLLDVDFNLMGSLDWAVLESYGIEVRKKPLDFCSEVPRIHQFMEDGVLTEGLLDLLLTDLANVGELESGRYRIVC